MKILISGAGIAGPALAHWLLRYGMDVTVVERAPAPRPGGHAVDVRGVARDVVGRMGLAGAVRDRQAGERGFALIDGAGRRLAEMPADMFGGDGIVAEVEIARGDLADVLYEATRDRATYRFGDRITALTADGEVTFASGGTGRYDVVVGADGVHSGVRRLAFGPDSAYVRPLGGCTAYFTVPDPGDLDGWMLMFNAPGRRVAALRPERGGTAKAMLSFTTDGPVPRDRAAQQRLIADRMAGVGWRVPDLLAAMPGAPDFFFDSIDQVRVERWSAGRTVLLGDAGYCGSPLAGLGTSMALVGAYVLAGELASAGSAPEAFAAYQAAMAAYVADGMQLPPGGVAGFAPRTAAAIRLRALSMRLAGRWPMRGLLARQFAKADNIVLKDYAGLPLGTGTA